MGVIGRWLCVLSVGMSTLAAFGTSPNVVVITLDTTRADRMGFLGSRLGLTPNLDALAKQSAVFTHAYAQAPLTPVSHATIFTGTYPQFHQVLDFPMPLAKDIPYAPDILRAQGYHTAAFIGSLALDPAGGAPGFDRGFDFYDADFHSRDFHQGDRYKTVERRGGEVVARTLAWLNQHPKDRPLFLWVHLYDAHDPYDPPEPYKTRYAKEPYDGEIAYVDSCVGKLLHELKVRSLYDDAVIAIMADHGESLGAHGEDTHGVFLYDETIQVPLLIKLPHAGATAEKRIDNRVELVDVLPTVLDAIGIAIPSGVQGKSLVGLMKPGPQGDQSAAVIETWRDRPAYAESDYPFLAYGWSATQALRAGKYLYIQAPRRELYDEPADPKAEHNLAAQSTAVADTLSGRLEDIRQKTTNRREVPKVLVDQSTRDKLAALGYVSSSNTSITNAPAGQAPDPKDKIQAANTIREINSLFENGRFNDAIPLLEGLIAKEPNMAILYAKLGGSYMKLRQFDKAVPVLRKATELDPSLSMAQMDLGRALLRVSDFNGAATVFEGVINKSPRMLDAHLFLEIAYFRAGRVPETIKECENVLEVMPENYGSYMLLGRALASSGKLEEAITKLQKAEQLRPESGEPHMALSEVYEKMGRNEDAARERAAAESMVGAMPPE
jgi:choline-sulfatase